LGFFFFCLLLHFFSFFLSAFVWLFRTRPCKFFQRVSGRNMFYVAKIYPRVVYYHISGTNRLFLLFLFKTRLRRTLWVSFFGRSTLDGPFGSGPSPFSILRLSALVWGM
jgi:hypothetical protein